MILKTFKSLILLVLLVVSFNAVQGHPSVPCRLELTIGTDQVDALLWLPTDDLTIALSKKWNQPDLKEITAESLNDELRARLKDYVDTFFAIKDGNGQAYLKNMADPQWQKFSEGAYISIAVTLTAPPNSDKTLVIYDNVVTEEIVNQKTLVIIQKDFTRGQFDPKIHTVLRRWKNEVTIDRSNASLWHGFTSMLEHGARHIAEGLDHLLFLLVLLMVAPISASQGSFWQRSWSGRKSPKESTLSLLAIITAFTVGHSITLALGVLGLVDVDSQMIEVLVGVSIAIGAVNLIHPIFARRESFIAIVFGLVHGLAFATTLSDFNLQGVSLLVALFSFNLGVELGQLAIIAIVGPLVLFLSRHMGYRLICFVTAFFALVSSLAWILERLDVPNRIASSLESAAQQPEITLSGVVICLLVAVIIQQVSSKFIQGNN